MRRTVFTLASICLIVGCSEFVGPEPPADEVHYPVGIAVHPNGQFVYVANSNFDAQYRTDTGGTLTVLDADTLKVLDGTTIRIGSFAGAVVLNGGREGDGDPDRLYVTTRGDDSVVVLDVNEGSGEIPGGDVVSCPNAEPGSQDALDCRITDLPRDPFALAMRPRPENLKNGRDLLAVAGLGGSVSFISLDGDRASLDVENAFEESLVVVAGASALRMYPGSDEAWVAGRFTRRIRSVTGVPKRSGREDTPNGSGELGALIMTSSIVIPSTIDRPEVRDLIFSEDGARAYVSLNSPSAIMTLDMRLDDEGTPLGTVLDRWDVDGAPAQMVLVREGGREVIYATLSRDEAIAVIDTETGIAIDRIPLDGLAYGLAYHADTHRLFATVFDAHSVVAIDVDPEQPTYRRVVGSTR